MYYFLNLFFVFSILGYCMEQGILTLFGQKYNSSLLHGPWTIVYGVATIVILWIGDKVSHIKINKFLQFCLFFVLSFFILSFLEFIAGIGIEKALGIVYWDYSNLPMHFGKYVCVPVSLVWSIYASILNYFIYPWAKKLIPKIPVWITFLFIIFFCLDIGYTIFEYLKYQ